MAKKTTQKKEVSESVEKPIQKLITIKQFLGTVAISHRDKWVVEKVYTGNSEQKTSSEWNKELKIKCKGITIKN